MNKKLKEEYKMAETLTGVNGSIIQWARERYNMSTVEAAHAIGIDLQRYEKWERNEEFPTYAMLKKISNVFQKPSALFFFPEPPTLPEINGELRTLPDSVTSSFSKQIVQQFEKAQAYQIYLQEIYGSRYCLLSEKDEFPTDIISLTKYIRGRLSFPIKAQKQRKSDKVVFEYFREKFYEQGIYVFKDAFGDNTVSGLCLYDIDFPIIIINNAMSFARQSFTLFHELYHLISRTSGAEIIRDDFYHYLDASQTVTEKDCDSFANEFLIPTDDFLLELKNKTLSDMLIADLASTYSVSKEAIMYKLYSLRYITSDDYNSLKEFFYGDAIRAKRTAGDEKSSGGNYYFTKLSYLGSQYTGAVFNQYFSGAIDSYRAGEMLNSKVEHLPKLEAAFFRGIK